MALVASDGLDMYNGVGANTGLLAKWLRSSGGSLVTGRFGGKALSHFYDTSNSDRYSTRALTSARSSLCVGAAFRWPILPNPGSNQGMNMFYWANGSTQVAFRATLFGELQLWNMASLTSGTLLATTGAGLILPNTWYYIQMPAVIDNVAGSVSLKVDDDTVLSASGIDTQNGSSSLANAVSFGCAGLSTGNIGATVQIDDITECDTNTPLDPARVESLYGTSDSVVAWTPNSGATNFSRVNETAVDGDTSYVSSSTPGVSDLYAMGSLSSNPLEIYGVQAVDFAQSTDANPRYLYQQMKSGATLDLGAQRTLRVGYNRHERMTLVDPNTGLAWGAGAVNSLLRGPNLAA